MTAPLLQVDDLHVRFPISGGGLFGTGRRMLHAVNGISFDIIGAILIILVLPVVARLVGLG